MNDSVFLWTFNVILQITCVSTFGLVLTTLFRKHPPVKCWVLSSSLALLLSIPVIVTLMQGTGLSLVSLDIRNGLAREDLLHGEGEEPAPPLSQGNRSTSARSPSAEMENNGLADTADYSLPGDFESGRRPDMVSSRHANDLAKSDASQLGTAQQGASLLNGIELQPENAGSSGDSTLLIQWRFFAGILISLWLAGAGLLLARVSLGWWQLHHILKRSTPNRHPLLLEIMPRVSEELRLKNTPELLFSDEVTGPVSAGLIRPRIVLPTDLVDQVSAADLHVILVHEAAHVLRCDQLTVLLQNIAMAIYWFHPLVAWLNRELAQAREEVCDNYALRTSTARSYSRTLLTLAELISPRPLPGTVSLLNSRWKLESRVADLLDQKRNRKVEPGGGAKLLFVGVSLVLSMVVALGTVTLTAREKDSKGADSSLQVAPEDQPADISSKAKQTPLLDGLKFRGTGDHREMLLRGRVTDVKGKPARGFEFVAKVYKSQLGRDIIPAKVTGSEFEVWIPVGGSYWRFIELAAIAEKGKFRTCKGIPNREIRQAAIEGIDMRLAPANRSIKVSVTHKGRPVANAHLAALMENNAMMQTRTDSEGVAMLRLLEGEKFFQLTAWTDDFRIGGYSFNRKPRHDPLGRQFTIELDDCHDQTVRFLDVTNGSPVPDLPFELIIGTGQPNYNFAALPSSFSQCRMLTNKSGEAIFRWFPNWETHGAYVEIIDQRWATAVKDNDLKVADDGALVMTLKRRIPRKTLSGKVKSDRSTVGGLLVEIKSFQGEEEGRSDHLYAFTDEEGNFTADCIPGAVYTVSVNDHQQVSNMIDLIPYELNTGKSNLAELEIVEAKSVEIRVTSGDRLTPMRNQEVYVRQTHNYTWLENGKVENGIGARDFPAQTDDEGIARVLAPAGSQLEIRIYAGDWRSGDYHVKVKDTGVTLVHIHRELDAEREVTGHLIAPAEMEVKLAGAEIFYGSIDGETDEREVVVADEEGRFAFKTRALQLGIFACTTDGKAAGIIRPVDLSKPLEIQLQPTMDLEGRLLGNNDEPLANHPVHVTPRVNGRRDFNKGFRTSFETKTFETRTDSKGNYTLRNLPTDFDMQLSTAPVDGSKDELSLDNFFLIAGEQRPLLVSRLGHNGKSDDRSLSDQYASLLRDAKLGGYRLLIMSYDAKLAELVSTKLLDHEANQDVMSFLNLHIEKQPLKEIDRSFAKSKDWSLPQQGNIYVYAVDETGKELGRIKFDTDKADTVAPFADFIRKHAPPQADAQAKWDAAFAEARRSGRRVWARVGQRYCGPCFRFSRWLDDHHQLLERDYVMLKVDNIRDENGAEVAKRIFGNHEQFSIPFHTIFDANEQVLIDSESPVGNIGNPASSDGCRHLEKMLRESCKNLTEADIKQIIATLKE